eukprot:TRINITY_DN21856_c0_g1_i1.p1 TRINITY_DN21856_c0_g1~~TRINITY_DN21856_c0_g1_i1.p1  ORF type:complete len:469 (-),score=44.91 TRINITY_DN21856_c0_g1_i1:630-2036(-)
MTAPAVDPRTGLPVVELPSGLRHKYPALLECLLFHCAIESELLPNGRRQHTLLVVTDDTIYTADPKGKITRCADLRSLASILTDAHRSIGLVFPNEFDMAFLDVENSAALANVLVTLVRHLSSSEPAVEQVSDVKMRVKLTKPKGWKLVWRPPNSRKAVLRDHSKPSTRGDRHSGSVPRSSKAPQPEPPKLERAQTYDFPYVDSPPSSPTQRQASTSFDALEPHHDQPTASFNAAPGNWYDQQQADTMPNIYGANTMPVVTFREAVDVYRVEPAPSTQESHPPVVLPREIPAETFASHHPSWRSQPAQRQPSAFDQRQPGRSGTEARGFRPVETWQAADPQQLTIRPVPQPMPVHRPPDHRPDLPPGLFAVPLPVSHEDVSEYDFSGRVYGAEAREAYAVSPSKRTREGGRLEHRRTHRGTTKTMKRQLEEAENEEVLREIADQLDAIKLALTRKALKAMLEARSQYD